MPRQLVLTSNALGVYGLAAATRFASSQALLMLMASPPAEPNSKAAAAAHSSYANRFAGGAVAANSSRGRGGSPISGRGSFHQLRQHDSNGSYGALNSLLQQQQQQQRHLGLQQPAGQEFLQAAGGPWFASLGTSEVPAGNAAASAGHRRSGSSRGRQRAVNGKRGAAGGWRRVLQFCFC
jgi:hypothetical protein